MPQPTILDNRIRINMSVWRAVIKKASNHGITPADAINMLAAAWVTGVLHMPDEHSVPQPIGKPVLPLMVNPPMDGDDILSGLLDEDLFT